MGMTLWSLLSHNPLAFRPSPDYKSTNFPKDNFRVSDPKDMIEMPVGGDAVAGGQEVIPAPRPIRLHQTPATTDARGQVQKYPKVDLDEIEAMACIGLSQGQMAEALRIQPGLFGRMTTNDPMLNEAIDRGKARGVKMVADALFANALKGNVAAQIFTLKARAGWSDKQEIDLKTTHEVKMSFDAAVEALKAAGIDPEKV
jgi:hypothetical protein